METKHFYANSLRVTTNDNEAILKLMAMVPKDTDNDKDPVEYEEIDSMTVFFSLNMIQDLYKVFGQLTEEIKNDRTHPGE